LFPATSPFTDEHADYKGLSIAAGIGKIDIGLKIPGLFGSSHLTIAGRQRLHVIDGLSSILDILSSTRPIVPLHEVGITVGTGLLIAEKPFSPLGSLVLNMNSIAGPGGRPPISGDIGTALEGVAGIVTFDPNTMKSLLAFFAGVTLVKNKENGHNPNVLEDSPAIKSFSLGNIAEALRLDLLSDLEEAFTLPDVMRLSDDPETLAGQMNIMRKIANETRNSAGLLMLLFLMKEQLGEHYWHSLRVGVAFCCLREALDPANGLSLGTLTLVGILHDAGKLAVPEEILFKNGRLDLRESKAMARHNQASRDILRPFEYDFPKMADIAIGHHPHPRGDVQRRTLPRRRAKSWVDMEQRDGTERRRKERRTPKLDVERAGILLRLADIFDALISKRGYKLPWPIDEVEKEMKKKFNGYERVIDYLLANFRSPI